MATALGSPKEEQQCRIGGGGGGGAVQAIAMLGATAVTAQAAYRARRVPWDLTFVLFAYATLGLLFLCLSMYERLPPPEQEEENGDDDDDDGAVVRRRLKMAVWALSTALSVAFAWRVAAVMPAPALKAAVWGMTSTVVVAGFYVLFVYRPAAISSYSELDTCKEEETLPKLNQIL
ncbi:hypothetical protein E2562_033355 [Oryza meyeriana var. granulata]|uniref:Uncharacterized protein n=1 Tax=Oryza meyeriana var. granulata TaxID=110450 RepID=A0A6G1E5V2_9ORYZ|nr:hypothetical protein E2562_033355 [Oryza meyeriana var. granulata]